MSDAKALSPFNSALETGVRALVLLAEAYPRIVDLQRLLMFDYLVVHTGDAEGPESLHPDLPLRNGELLVRRHLVERGVLLMVSRRLVDRLATDSGIGYVAAEGAEPYLDQLRAPYTRRLRERAAWVITRFADHDDASLKRFFDANFERWTREFQSVQTPGGVP